MVHVKEEQETILRYDQEDKRLHLYTAWPNEARRWERLGYPVTVLHCDRAVEPVSWEAVVPLNCLRPLRRLVKGAIVKRRASLTAFGGRKRPSTALSGEEKMTREG
jgi:hypothetical protein